MPYVCTYAAKPTYNVAQTNTATVTWQQPGGAPITQTTTAQFTFNDGTTGNPSVTGDSATVTDTFNGGTPVSLGVVTQTTTFNDLGHLRRARRARPAASTCRTSPR